MKTIPGKLDCTRIGHRCCSTFMQIVLFVTFLVGSQPSVQAQPAIPQYPELARLGPSSYCNPFFGFRLLFSEGLKAERIHLPVQPQGRHALLALHLQRLDRSAELFVSAFQDSAENPDRLAAKVRVQQARHGNLTATGPRAISIHGQTFYRLHIASDTSALGDESSFYFFQRGYVVHFAIFSHQPELAVTVESVIEHLEFVDPGDTACREGNASDPYYGPALPTDLVDSTVRTNPGASIPSGEFSGRSFRATALGVRVELPPRFQPLPSEEAYRIIELLRDPMNDPESDDRRRALFRACSRVLFAAIDPQTEILSQVHPGLAVAAVPKGCVPDLIPPNSPADKEKAAEFATVLARSLGATLANRGHIRLRPGGLLTSHLDGALPYRSPGEKLSRRASLSVSATANGNWLILVYAVASSPAGEREMESRIVFGAPEGDPIAVGP